MSTTMALGYLSVGLLSVYEVAQIIGRTDEEAGEVLVAVAHGDTTIETAERELSAKE